MALLALLALPVAQTPGLAAVTLGLTKRPTQPQRLPQTALLPRVVLPTPGVDFLAALAALLLQALAQQNTLVVMAASKRLLLQTMVPLAAVPQQMMLATAPLVAVVEPRTTELVAAVALVRAAMALTAEPLKTAQAALAA